MKEKISLSAVVAGKSICHKSPPRDFEVGLVKLKIQSPRNRTYRMGEGAAGGERNQQAIKIKIEKTRSAFQKGMLLRL